MLYLDHAATTPMRPPVWEAMEPFAHDVFGNSSGSHAVSRRAKNALEEARERAAGMLGCRPQEIVFTGGGTEADNLAVKGAALGGSVRRGVVTAATEHEAVLEAASFLGRIGCPVTVLPVDRSGVVDPELVGAAVADDTAVVSIMLANNETGAISAIPEVVDAVGGRALVHTDAVQAFVSLDVRLGDLRVDLLSLAAHKFGGPKGVGLLYVRDGVALEPVVHGGGQELGRRSGTHNVMGAVGMVTAMELTMADRDRFVRDVTAAREAFEEQVGGSARRTIPAGSSLAQHLHLHFPGVSNETMLVKLDRAGVAASAASACQSGATTVSHVLTAMGVAEEQARESLRFSFGWTTGVTEAREAGAIVRSVVEGLQ
jgi:cysteine desulfurase